MNPISIDKIIAPDLIPQPPAAGREKAGEGFASLLSEAIDRVGQLQGESDQQLRALLAGDPVDLHRVLLAGQKAGLASGLMMSVRNKLVDAYQEVMRMQV